MIDGTAVMSKRMAWPGEAAWVRASDKAKTALNDDSVTLAGGSELAAGVARRAAEVMGTP